MTHFPDKKCYYTSSFHSCLHCGGENCPADISQAAVSKGEMHSREQFQLLGQLWEPRNGTDPLATQNTRLVVLLIYRLVVPRSGTLSPIGVKSLAIFLKVDPQGEYYGDVYSKYKPVCMLISHL